MAMLNFNPPMFTTQPPSHDRNALIPSVPIPSIGGRLVFPPPRPLSLAFRRGRDSHVPNSFRDLLRLGNAFGSPEVSRIHEDDVEVVDSDYEDVDVRGDEDEDEIGDDLFVLGLGSRMQKWFENKPSGFGEGKVYDTSIEDNLLEEMRQSQIAQAANINKLKHSGDKAAGKKLKQKKNEVVVEEEDEVVPSGVQVRVGNLPKKKNIHRDLNLAFKGFSGISAIVPAVAGNKKTRDPVCLGFAHVYLKTEEDARRFVRTFSGQALTFGRVQKQIKCGMTNPHAEISAQKAIDEDPESDSRLALTVEEKYPFVCSQSDEDDVVEEEFQLMDENSEYFIVSDFDDVEDERLSLPSSSDRQKKAAGGAVKPRAKSRRVNKPPGKGKSGKLPKLEIPGSAKRLKIREKTVLTGVLSKYHAMAASTTSDS